MEAAVIRRATLLIRDGSAIGKTKVDQIDPSLWSKAENYFEQLSITKTYQHLKLNAQEKNIHMGMKQGLMGDLSGIYIWFLIPYYSDNKEEIGNLLFLEAAGDDHGKATYVFRLMDWEFYERTKDLSVLHAIAEKSICNINYCLNIINFRREPIYIQSQRNSPQYKKYRRAIEVLPTLQLLREYFVGRVIHSSDKQWMKDIALLMDFSKQNRDSSVKWKK